MGSGEFGVSSTVKLGDVPGLIPALFPLFPFFVGPAFGQTSAALTPTAPPAPTSCVVLPAAVSRRAEMVTFTGTAPPVVGGVGESGRVNVAMHMCPALFWGTGVMLVPLSTRRKNAEECLLEFIGIPILSLGVGGIARREGPSSLPLMRGNRAGSDPESQIRRHGTMRR